MRGLRYYKNLFFAGKLAGPSRAEGSGILSSVADTGLELFISKGIPYLAKKGVEAGRYNASEAIRDRALQKKAINYGTRKAQPSIEKVGSELLNQLSIQRSAQTNGIKARANARNIVG